MCLFRQIPNGRRARIRRRLAGMVVGAFAIASGSLAGGTIDTLPAGPVDGFIAAVGALVHGGTFVADDPNLAAVTLAIHAPDGAVGRPVVLTTENGVPDALIWRGPDIRWPLDAPERSDGMVEFTFFPNVAVVPGNPYFVGIDFGLFAEGVPELLYFVGVVVGDPIPAGRTWAYIDGSGWHDTGSPDHDLAARIVMIESQSPDGGPVVLHRSSAIGPSVNDPTDTLCFSLDNDQYLGSRFTLEFPAEVAAVGGHFLGGDEIFAAIVRLNDVTDLPVGEPFGPGETIASAVFPISSPSGEFSVPLEAALQPGRYALVFGTGNFGTRIPPPPPPNGAGCMPANNADIPGRDSYFFWNGSDWIDWVDSQRGLHFVVWGTPLESECFPDLEDPQIVVSGRRSEIGGTRYFIRTLNRSSYPNALFEEAPDLPPCGLNSRASRTWASAVSEEGSRLNTFCALSANSDLDRLWFFVPDGAAAPARVRLELLDRRCGLTYRSLPVPTSDAPDEPPPARDPPRGGGGSSPAPPRTEPEMREIVVPNFLTAVEGNSRNYRPFFTFVSCYQQVYDAGEFDFAGPREITGLAFRPDTEIGQERFSIYLSKIEIRLSTTSRRPDRLHFFCRNVGEDETIVRREGSLTLRSRAVGPDVGPREFDVVIPFRRSFRYDPSKGHLLLEIRNTGRISSGSGATFLDASKLSDSVSRVWNGAFASYIDTIGLVTKFFYLEPPP